MVVVQSLELTFPIPADGKRTIGMRRSLRGSACAALLGSAAPLLLAVLALLWVPAPVSAQIGTTLRNISSESSNFTCA